MIYLGREKVDNLSVKINFRHFDGLDNIKNMQRHKIIDS